MVAGSATRRSRGTASVRFRVENVSSGVYAQQSDSIQVQGIFCRNVKGPFPRGQMVQLNNVTVNFFQEEWEEFLALVRSLK